MNTGFTKAAVLAGLLACGASASAATIYENVGTIEGNTPFTGTAEIGDVATFTGTDRVLTDWKFEYWVDPNSTIAGQAQVYAYDGGVIGALLYQSPTYADLSLLADATGYGTFQNVAADPITLPETVLWSVTFTPATGSEELGYGLLFTGTAETGTSGDFYYVRTGTEWGLAETATLEDSFAAQFNAVPEPSTWALLVGGIGLLSLWSFRRKA